MILKRLLMLLLLGVVLLPIVLLCSRYVVTKESRWRLYDEAIKIPYNKAALVLGCSPYTRDGRTNLFFKYRMDAAVRLYEAGKVEVLIVSGDNSTHQYDEPSAMKEALIKRGVPSDVIYCDYAGFRTLDSVIRAREIFQQENITIVSQKFHNQRAIFLAKKRGIQAIGYNARELRSRSSLKTRVREWFARTKSLLDIYVLNRQPKFLGPTIEIADTEIRGPKSED